MANVQLYLAIGVPILTNAAMLNMIMVLMNSRFDGHEKLFSEQLRRVEEVLDARLRLSKTNSTSADALRLVFFRDQGDYLQISFELESRQAYR